MKEKEVYFGSTTVEKKDNGLDVLTVCDYFGDCEVTVHDAEIKENEESLPLVGIKLIDCTDKEQEFFIHKKDCLPLAAFLLDIHTEYSNRINELELQEYSKRFSKEE